MQKFFSNVWFKCIVFLLVLASFLGGLLAVLNPLLAVSAEERTARAISKIYGEQKEYQVILDVDAENGEDAIIYENVGSINKIFTVGETDTLFQVTGYKGYKNGTITLWVRVSENDGKLSITKIIIESNEKQTLMSKLDGRYTDGFLIDITNSYKNGEFFYADNKHSSAENYNPITGATYSATAAGNAVNCVIKYVGGEK